jgi:hypothetical protein
VIFVIRIAFWIALIVMVLPSDREQQARLYQTATETVHRAATFCERNAKLCEQGAQHWAVFRTKLEFGAKLVFDVASERFFGVQPAVHRPDQDQPPASGQQPRALERSSGRVGA